MALKMWHPGSRNTCVISKDSLILALAARSPSPCSADSKINHFFPLAQWMRIGGLGGDWGFALWGFALWSFLHFHFITSLYCCIEAVLNSLIVCHLPFIYKTYWSFALWSSSSWSFSSSLVFGQIEPTASSHPDEARPGLTTFFGLILIKLSAKLAKSSIPSWHPDPLELRSWPSG